MVKYKVEITFLMIVVFVLLLPGLMSCTTDPKELAKQRAEQLKRDNPEPLDFFIKNTCDNINPERRAQFILDCSQKAIQKADDNTESIIEQCEETSSNVFCKETWVQFTGPHGDDSYNPQYPCSITAEPKAREFCDRFGHTRIVGVSK